MIRKRADWASPLAFSVSTHALGALALLLVVHRPDLIRSSAQEIVDLSWGARSGGKPAPHARSADRSQDSSTPVTNAVSAVSKDGERKQAPAQNANPGTGGVDGSGSGAGSATGGGTTVGSADPYYGRIHGHIQSRLRYPSSFARRKIQGRVEMRLELKSDGELKALTVEHSSGSAEIDRYVEENIRSAAPFETYSAPESFRVLIIPIELRPGK